MTSAGQPNLGAMSMRELLRMEVETQSRVLIDNLLELERDALTDRHMEAMMRAAHSMKGGARIAGLQAAVELAHVMEDLFVAARAGKVALRSDRVDALLQATDLLVEMAQAGVGQDDLPAALVARAATTRAAVVAIAAGGQQAAPREAPPENVATPAVAPTRDERLPPDAAAPSAGRGSEQQPATARTLRVSIESMNRLMGLVGELSVKDKVGAGILGEAFQVRRRVREIGLSLDALRRRLADRTAGDSWQAELDEIITRTAQVEATLGRSASALETHDAQTTEITRQMQREVIAHRMQPFGDLAQGFRRLVRNLAERLGKEVALVIEGTDVGVDRDSLERLGVPLTHLIQNAIDHGIGSPGERVAAGKPACGTVTLSAQHRGGLLSIVVEDDGVGVDLDLVREAVVERKLASEAVAASLQEHELLEFLFLPNFTSSRQVSDISGRGVGLDLVRHTLHEVRGTVRVATQAGRGTRFEITLPVTLIVARCLVVEIAGELFALPVGRIVRALRPERDAVQLLENRQYLMLDGVQIGLVSAAELLELPSGAQRPGALAVVVLAKSQHRYGLVVDRLVGERPLVERPLDPRLGEVEDIASASTLEDGSPVLILDVDDVLHSIERLAGGRAMRKVGIDEGSEAAAQRRRVLVVDDSITVREVERGLLRLHDYAVDVAVDGVEGWNALRRGKYDLVVTDVDMPRMNGIELVKLIRADARLRDVPVIVVSYKDREEDRMSGLDAGADRYLTKGSFEDDTFVRTVVDLIGKALP